MLFLLTRYEEGYKQLLKTIELVGMKIETTPEFYEREIPKIRNQVDHLLQIDNLPCNAEVRLMYESGCEAAQKLL